MTTFGIYIALCIFIAFAYLLGYRQGHHNGRIAALHDWHRFEASLKFDPIEEEPDHVQIQR
jgi:hypothetical protein